MYRIITAQQEQAEKRMLKRRTATRYRFTPAGYDRFSPHANTPADGAVVVKTQPFGAPPNGTMGHVYVEDAVTGEFCGLVQLASLVKVSR
jgi:hypothetical protein